MFDATRMLVGVGLESAPGPFAQTIPTNWFDSTEERTIDFGNPELLGVLRRRIPPKGEVAMFAPLLVTMVFRMSKAAPSRMMPPALLLVTLT